MEASLGYALRFPSLTKLAAQLFYLAFERRLALQHHSTELIVQSHSSFRMVARPGLAQPRQGRRQRPILEIGTAE